MSGKKLLDSKEKEITVADLQKVKTDYDRLLEVSFNVMGGMEDCHRMISLKLENDVPIYMEEMTSDRSLPIRIVKCALQDETIFTELEQYIREYNLPAWNELPFDEEMIALDAPSTYITLIYDNSAIGGYRQESYSISYDDKIPEGGYDILNKLRDRIASSKDESMMIETYLLPDIDNDKKRIYTGKDIRNSDDEIMDLLRGYWRDKEDDAYLDLYRPELGLSYCNTDYVFKEIVHQNLDDLDSSWYAVFECEGKELCLTVVKDTLLLLSEGQTEEMKRN